ncbi:MAG: ABC transporter substrate-binding protein [Bacteroidota bacterium]
MKKINIAICFLLSLLVLTSCGDKAISQKEPQLDHEEKRIVSLSGFLTETLIDLGLGDHIVGRDITSTFPPEKVNEIPSLGHVSQLNMEAVLALNPKTVILEEAQAKQAKELEKLSEAGIEIITVPTSRTFDNAQKASKFISQKIKLDEKALGDLAKGIEKDSLALAEILNGIEDDQKPRVLFIYARGAGRLMVGGSNTSASAIIEKAGGVNAIESFENFQALTPEYLVEASPDVILMFTSGIASLDGKEGLGQIPGVAQTPAYKNDRIVAMDGHYLTAFGSRAAQAAKELALAIHDKEM